MKSHSKSKKREIIKVIKRRSYHIQDKNHVEMAGIKKEDIGFEKRNRNGISPMYNIICDSDFGVGRAVIRRILCVCNSCIK